MIIKKYIFSNYKLCLCPQKILILLPFLVSGPYTLLGLSLGLAMFGFEIFIVVPLEDFCSLLGQDEFAIVVSAHFMVARSKVRRWGSTVPDVSIWFGYTVAHISLQDTSCTQLDPISHWRRSSKGFTTRWHCDPFTICRLHRTYGSMQV